MKALKKSIKWRPELLPNEETGTVANWEERIKNPSEWLVSNKLDGARVELFGGGTVKGRSLKDIPSVHIQQMAKDVMSIIELQENTVIEAEFYSEEMTFPEIMHFFRSEDVTSAKSVTKYTKLWAKTKGEEALGWKFPGRSVEWLTSWHDSLKFYAFNVMSFRDPTHTFEFTTSVLKDIIDMVYTVGIGILSPDIVYIRQNKIEHLDELFQMYDQAIIDGIEGVVIKRKDCIYKNGRHTLKSGQVYKIKDNKVEYDGIIVGLVEGTVAIEGSAKTINELGRSRTSQLKEDRQPSGMCSGLDVLMENGNKLTVSLSGFDHPARIKMLQEPIAWIGETIRFTGMPPVKEGSVPRHAMFLKGNIRDAK